jgi:hypothetical protein
VTVVLLSQDVGMEIKSGPGCDWDTNSDQASLTITCWLNWPNEVGVSGFPSKSEEACEAVKLQHTPEHDFFAQHMPVQRLR